MPVRGWGKGNGKRGTGQLASKVIERLQPRYEVQDVELGEVYKWRPERIVLECRCGHTLSLTASNTSCAECSTDHEQAVTEASNRDRRHQSDHTLHPWRYHYYSEDHKEDGGLPF